MNIDLRSAFFEIDGLRFERCLADGFKCDQPAIRAHSIQNAAHLGLLQRDGHVVQLTRRFEDGAPQVDFSSVGRNRASTFAGLCVEHDRELFAEIEIQPIQVADPWHRFLLTYRAVLRETHVAMDAGGKAHRAYRVRVEAGLDPADRPSPAGLMATERLMVAYETYLLKEEFDVAYATRDHGYLEHDVLDLVVASPSIAASTLFSLDGLEKDDGTTRVCLSILPLTRTRTVAAFSYRRSEAHLARAGLGQVLESEGSRRLYELSRLLLNSCENFVVGPDAFDNWSAEKQEAIRSFYIRTMFEDALDCENEFLMLFTAGT